MNMSKLLQHLMNAVLHAVNACTRTQAMLRAAVARAVALMAIQRAAAI